MPSSVIGYLFQGVSILVGIVVGVIVTIISQRYIQKQKDNETLGYLKFEIDLNIGKISQWLEEIETYRNAVSSDTLNIYAGYFDLSRIATSFYYNTIYSGLLYKYLDFDSVYKLQILFSEFVLSWENLLNKQIADNIKTFKEDRKRFDKTTVIQQINFWENKFKAHKKTLQEVKRRFERNNSKTP